LFCWWIDALHAQHFLLISLQFSTCKIIIYLVNPTTFLFKNTFQSIFEISAETLPNLKQKLTTYTVHCYLPHFDKTQTAETTRHDLTAQGVASE
jgi:hypothetical protein